MSKENLNINEVNPLEEKSNEIKFTVDKMGLATPGKVIPTDVDYFVRKQRGEIEPKYTWSEALAKSFEIDNLFVSGFNKFMQPDGPQIDFDFEPTKKMFDIINKYPSYMQDAFFEAKSEDHFYSIQKQVEERIEIENEISKLGWKGFGARMIAAVADPAAIGLSIATIPFGGYGAYATIPTKVMRLKRALKFGAIVGAENLAIESGLVALDPMKNPDDIKYAFLAGFGLGSPAGWLGRVNATKNKVPNDIVVAYKKTDVAAEKMKQNLEFEETQQFAAENNFDLNPDYIKNQRMKLTDEANSMNPKVVDDIRNEPGVGTYWEENFKKTHLRFDLAGQLNRSPDPLIRRFRETFVSDPVVGNPRGDTAVEWKQRTSFQTMYPYMNYREIALRSFKSLNKDVSFKNTLDVEERFETLMSDLKEFPERYEFSNEITPEMKNLAKYADQAFNDTLDIVSQTGREGWEDVARFRRKNYIPHVHSSTKLNQGLDAYGEKQIQEIYANALKDMRGDLGDKTFNSLISKMVKKIASPNFFGQESDLAKILQGTNEPAIREFLEDLELTKDQIDAIIAKIQKGSGNTLDRNANRRLPFDLNARIDVKNLKTNKIESVSVKDFTDRNLTRLLRMYNSQVLGSAAMARFGNFKNNKEFKNFMAKLDVRSKDFRKYNKFYRDKENIEVIVASITGRQSPLEKGGDPNGFTRRMARLVQDYNFLRLFGQVGFAQGAELYQGISEIGLKTFLKANPAFKDILDKLKAGQIKFDDPILEELRSQGIPVGLDKFMHTPTGRFDNELELPIGTTGGKLDNVELLSGKAKRFVADISFLNPMTMYTQIIMGRGMALKISDIVNDYVKKFNTTKIYNKLSKGDQIRFKRLGWTEDQFNRIAKEIKKHSIYKDGKYQSINLEQWSPEARANYNIGMQRFIDNVVQRNDVGSLNRFFTTDYTRILTQFRTFTLGSYTKQLMNRLYVLAETRGKDYHTYATFMASMIGAAQFYAVQSYINSFGRSDRKEYLQKRLSVENLAKIGFLRSSWSSLLPGAIDSALHPFMEKTPFSYGRNTELASNFVNGIPTINLLNTTLDSTRTLTKLAFDGSYQASKSDISKLTSLIPLQNALIIKNINNMIVDDLGE
ncbi:hypothetical protein CMO95_03560 [Candidatus Woesearchaeota archaeon]|nr:hypothetical protein [Candidatus Woesearchaeota archaeon]|tara:strand:- start:60 stop:3434 length:3375 start_codon:yes stop_codon:yes gene_type:complete